jgi:hypothetical protein
MMPMSTLASPVHSRLAILAEQEELQARAGLRLQRRAHDAVIPAHTRPRL